MASFANFVVVSILAATALGSAPVEPAQFMKDGAKIEATVTEACETELEVGTLAGPEGDVAAGGACVCGYGVAAVVIVAPLIAGVAMHYGCAPWKFATPSSSGSKPHKPLIVARPSVLQDMNGDLKKLDETFAKLGSYLNDMTQSINEKSWGDVAAWAAMALGTATQFTFYTQQALVQGSCDQPPPEVTCPDSYELLNDGDTKTCQDQALDCYDACCREQDTWCDGESQCKLARGCGPTLTPAPSFRDVNCKDLEATRADFGEAIVSLNALHDCARHLSKGVKSSNSCSSTVEQQVRAQIVSEFAQVNKDLGTLAKLYNKTTPSLAMALVDKRSNVPSNLVVLANAPWQQSYAQVSSSCDSMKRKANVWLECKGSTPGGRMQVGEMPISLFLIVILLVAGCYVYFRFIDSDRRGRVTGVAGGRAPRLVEKARPKVFVTFLLLYTLLIGLVALRTPSPIKHPAGTSAYTGTAALCQQNLQHAQNMFKVCDDFASALKAGSDSGNVSLEELLSKTVTGMARIDKDTMPK